MTKTLGAECENCQEYILWDDLRDGLCEECYREAAEEREREAEPDVWPFRGFDEDWGRPERQ